MRTQADDLAVEWGRDERHRQRFVHLHPWDGQPADVTQDHLDGDLLATEGAVRKAPLDAQASHRAPRPQARYQVDGEEEVGDGEEEVDAQEGGDGE